MIQHEETGLLAPLGDMKALRSHWELILDDRNLAERLTEAARRFVNDHYSAARMARDYHDLFRNLELTT